MKIKKTYQDNKSYVFLHKNYSYSTKKSSKYVYADYVFAVNKIKQKEVKIAYYPIEKIIVNHSSKPT